jgi:bifunctional enzyme CysN/CysC
MQQFAPAAHRPLRVVIVGHVDHGKSTLIGRLLYDTGDLPPVKVDELRAVSQRRGMPMEWSFALDAFQAERDQAVTIDVTHRRFRTARRSCVIIDAPGHREFLKNMISGAAGADAAVLVVDAVEGVREQTRRHAYLLHTLGLRQVVVAVNKMDLVNYAANRFVEVAREIEDYLGQIGLAPAATVPVAARGGDNLATTSTSMPWYRGGTILQALDELAVEPAPIDLPLRFPVQDVYRLDERRILVGRIETGTLSVGDVLLFSPSGQVARVRSLEAWGTTKAPIEAHAGQSIGLTLDQPIFVERGDVASTTSAPPSLTSVFRFTLFWLSRRPLKAGDRLKAKLATREAMVTVQAIERVIDTETLQGNGSQAVPHNAVAEVILRSRELLSLDEHAAIRPTGRCVLVDGFDVVAGGIVSLAGLPDQLRPATVKASNLTAVDHLVDPHNRALRNGHRGAVVWLTGLSGAGKSTLAMALERRLFVKGCQVYVLDGDNVRRGLNADLGFSAEERAENIRRVGEVAALFADSGAIAVTAFISPFRSDRQRARRASGEAFHEVHVKASLHTCEQRDPKGLYRRARAGQIREFTGVSSPYEPPDHPELVVDTEMYSIEDCVAQILGYIERQIMLTSLDAGL